MGKYDPLRAYLSGLNSDEVAIGFGDIEGLVGALPRSARLNGEWWANGSTVQALAWHAAGWRVKSADQGSEVVIFVRGAANSVQSAKPLIKSAAHSTNIRNGSTPPATETTHVGESGHAQPSASSTETSKRWPALLAAAATAIGTAAVTVVGLAAIPRWAIFLIALDLSAFLTVITSAITDAKYRILSLSTGNALLIALVAGIAVYNLAPQNPTTVTVVPNTDVTLSAEAGGAPDLKNPDGTVLSTGDDETATCYALVKGTTWLYFHFSDEVYGWAPLSDFHYDPGFTGGLPSSCS